MKTRYHKRTTGKCSFCRQVLSCFDVLSGGRRKEEVWCVAGCSVPEGVVRKRFQKGLREICDGIWQEKFSGAKLTNSKTDQSLTCKIRIFTSHQLSKLFGVDINLISVLCKGWAVAILWWSRPDTFVIEISFYEDFFNIFQMR